MDQKYHLYAMRPQDIPDAERFFLITPDYAYLYTQNSAPVNSTEVTDLGILQPLALEWLREQVAIVRTEYIRKHSAEVLQQAEDFTSTFKQELAKEQQKLKRKKKTSGEG